VLPVVFMYMQNDIRIKGRRKAKRMKEEQKKHVEVQLLLRLINNQIVKE
jgi:hypothetical protein